jgi:hypothetical protein
MGRSFLIFARINEAAQAVGASEDFSTKIRASLPTIQHSPVSIATPSLRSSSRMKTAHLLLVLAALVLGCLPSQVLAGRDTDALAACLADNSTGKERKALARWVFLGMSAHPEMRSLSLATDNDRSAAQREMSDLVTRLVTIQCAQQVKAAVKSDGTDGMVQSFKVLGELAMRELMTDPDVAAAMKGYVQYLDREKFEKALFER